jgi:hypothetical protein
LENLLVLFHKRQRRERFRLAQATRQVKAK